MVTKSGGFGAADCQTVNQKSRLTDPDGNALAVLAACADARVKAHVMADGADIFQHFMAGADQRRALDRRAHPAVFDVIRLGSREHELARCDVHLSAAEIDRVKPFRNPPDDIFRRFRAGLHNRVAHTRHGLVRIALAPPVSGRDRPHQPSIQPVLHIADQNTVLDQRGALGRGAFIINGERAAPVGQRAVIDHRDPRRADALPHQPPQTRWFSCG